jgi:hypothetical protein
MCAIANLLEYLPMTATMMSGEMYYTFNIPLEYIFPMIATTTTMNSSETHVHDHQSTRAPADNRDNELRRDERMRPRIRLDAHVLQISYSSKLAAR